jgi:hypothetical protein
MKIIFVDFNGVCIAEILSNSIEIRNTQDALDIMASCYSQGAQRIIIDEKNIISHFFDLKTGIAGEIFEKISDYNVVLAIVGDFSKFPSSSLRDFIYESNKSGRINFVNSIAEAQKKLVRV